MKVHTQRAAFLLALVFAMEAQAVPERCGTDDFGNAVCIDKDGVVMTAPQAGKAEDTGIGSAAGAPKVEAESDEKRERSRCGIDPFGNKVCR